MASAYVIADVTDAKRVGEGVRQAVAAREKFQALSPIVAPCPDVLHAHRAELYGNERFKTFRDEGWEIAIVDLTRVCVVQHTVVTEPDARITRLDANDLPALADITLPETIRAAYREAIAQKYLFYSYGDAMLIL